MGNLITEFVLGHLLCLISFFLLTDIIRFVHSRTVITEFNLAEELQIGTKVGNIRTSLLDTGMVLENELIGYRYQFMNSRQPYFRLNASSGQLMVNSRIDRESLCDAKITRCKCNSNECFLSELVADPQPATPSHEMYIDVKVNILDVNDNKPAWSTKVKNLEVIEHSPVTRTRLRLPTANDPDQGPQNTTVRYELAYRQRPSRQSALGAFSLRSEVKSSGPNEPKRFDLFLQVDQNLDRETRSHYQLDLMAIDGGTPKLTGFVTLNITVTDINDQEPKFKELYPRVTVKENLELNFTIYQPQATDDDPSNRDNLVYKFAASASNSVKKLFSIDSRSGRIFLKGKLDYEKYSQPYLIPIIVSDGKHRAECTLTVQVENVNDNAPKIELQSYYMLRGRDDELRISEHFKQNQVLATLTVTDEDDQGLSSKQNGNLNSERRTNIQCRTNIPQFNVLPLDPEQVLYFKLIPKVPFDRERTSYYGVMLRCTDNGNPPRSTTKLIKVIIEDENDCTPKFTEPVYMSSIEEGDPVGTVVKQVVARDADSPNKTNLRYRLDTFSTSVFKIDSITGVIRTRTIFDREQRKQFNITVTVTDELTKAEKDEEDRLLTPNRIVGPRAIAKYPRINTATATVIVIIKDINDQVPQFNQSSYEFSVQEHERAHIRIGCVKATDADSLPINHRLSYSMKPKPNEKNFYFKVTKSGDIYTTKVPIDRETTPVIPFQVIVTDHGQPRLSSSVDVLVHVKDINDHTPFWVYPHDCESSLTKEVGLITPKNANHLVNISQESPVGQTVAKLKAIDMDEGSRGEIIFSITGGNMGNYFDIDPQTGEIFLAKTLPPNEIGRLHGIFLKVSDKATVPKTNSCVLEVNVLSGSAYRTLTSRYIQKDLLVMVAMIVITLVISVFLIATLIVLRWQSCQRYWYKHRQSYIGTTRTGYPDGRSSPTLSDLQPSQLMMLCQSPTGDMCLGQESTQASVSADDAVSSILEGHYQQTHHPTRYTPTGAGGGYYTIDTRAMISDRDFGRGGGKSCGGRSLGSFSDTNSVDSERDSSAAMSLQTFCHPSKLQDDRGNMGSLRVVIGGKGGPAFFHKNIDSYKQQSDTGLSMQESTYPSATRLKSFLSDAQPNRSNTLHHCKDGPTNINQKSLSVKWIDGGEKSSKHTNNNDNDNDLSDKGTYQQLSLDNHEVNSEPTMSAVDLSAVLLNKTTFPVDKPASTSSSPVHRAATPGDVGGTKASTYTPLLSQTRPGTPNLYSKQPASFV